MVLKDLTTNCSVNREFFRLLGHFTDEDLKVYVEHLLGMTFNKAKPYPKVSVQKPKNMVVDNHSGEDRVERQKHKKVIIEELVAIKPSLDLKNSNGNINHSLWQRGNQNPVSPLQHGISYLQPLSQSILRSDWKMRLYTSVLQTILRNIQIFI